MEYHLKTHALLMGTLFTVLVLTTIAIFYVFPSTNRVTEIDLPSNLAVGSIGNNFVKDPSFEEEPKCWQPIAWQGVATFSWTSLMARSGKFALAIQSNASNTISAWRLWPLSAMIDVKSGTRYDVSVWAKVEYIDPSSRGVYVSIAWFDSSGNWLGVSAGEAITCQTNGWRKIWTRGVAPQNAAKCSIELHLDGKGLVFFDDIYFEESLPTITKSNNYSIVCVGTLFPSIKVQDDHLTMCAYFVSTDDEFVMFKKVININPIHQPFMTVRYRVSYNQPAGPGIFIEFQTVSGRILTYPLDLSKDWTSSKINIFSLTGGEEIVEVRFILNDWVDSFSDDNLLIVAQFSKPLLYSWPSHYDVLSLLTSCLLFVLVTLDSCYTRHKLNKIMLLLASIAIASILPSLVLPFLVQERVNFVALGSMLAILVTFIIKYASHGKRMMKSDKTQVINFVTLLLAMLISWVGFLIRVNKALTTPLFCDEISYGVMSWGLLNGRLVGVHFPGPWLPEVPTFFKLEPWPDNLPLLYCGDWVRQGMFIVSPFFAIPYFLPLISSPFIALMGFSEFVIRLPYIIMSTIAIIVTFLIGRYFSNETGLIAAALMAMLPYPATLGSRAFVDNGVLLFLALSTLSYIKYKKFGSKRYLYLGAIFAGLSTLSKLFLGFLALAFWFFALIPNQRHRQWLFKTFLPISLSFFASFIVTSLAINYRGFLWSLYYFIWYAPQVSGPVALGPLQNFGLAMILSSPELAFALCCLLSYFMYCYSSKSESERSTFMWPLLVSNLVFVALLPTRPWWLVPSFLLLMICMARMFTIKMNDKYRILLKGILLLAFASLIYLNPLFYVLPIIFWVNTTCMLSFTLLLLITHLVTESQYHKILMIFSLTYFVIVVNLFFIRTLLVNVII